MKRRSVEGLFQHPRAGRAQLQRSTPSFNLHCYTQCSHTRRFQSRNSTGCGRYYGGFDWPRPTSPGSAARQRVRKVAGCDRHTVVHFAGSSIRRPRTPSSTPQRAGFLVLDLAGNNIVRLRRRRQPGKQWRRDPSGQLRCDGGRHFYIGLGKSSSFHKGYVGGAVALIQRRGPVFASWISVEKSRLRSLTTGSGFGRRDPAGWGGWPGQSCSLNSRGCPVQAPLGRGFSSAERKRNSGLPFSICSHGAPDSRPFWTLRMTQPPDANLGRPCTPTSDGRRVHHPPPFVPIRESLGSPSTFFLNPVHRT